MSLDICEKALRIAEKLGADQAECYYFSEEETELKIKKGELKSFERKRDEGIAIRVILNKTLGFYYSTNLKDLEAIVSNAIKLAKVGTPDPYLVSFVSKKPYSHVEGIYDKTIEAIDFDELFSLIKDAINKDYDPRIVSVNLSLSLSRYEEAISNSLGVLANEKATLNELEISVAAKDSNNFSSSFDFATSRRLNDLGIKERLNTVCDLALKGLNKKKIASGEYPVIIDPFASLFILYMSLNQALNSDLVQRKRSFLSEYLNKEIATTKLTVVDDGLLEGAVGSSSFDGEGHPSIKNVLIDKGVLKSFMYDNYTAKKESRESTGNATREDFRNLPRISSRNLIVSPGSTSIDELLKEVNSGIYLRSTFDYPNVITGEFSGMINEGFYIEKGEMKHSLLQTGISISLKEFLKDIVELSKESMWVGNFKVPYILLSKAKIASR